MELRLRRATFQNLRLASRPEQVVDYVILDDGRCIFSAHGHQSGDISTINGVEWIIGTIAGKERRLPASLEFHDLQTHRGYPHCLRPGTYSFDVITFGSQEGVVTPNWEMIECPEEILSLFRDHVGGESPFQQQP